MKKYVAIKIMILVLLVNFLNADTIPLSDAKAISAGFEHTLVIRGDSNTVLGVGRNSDGQLGNNTQTSCSIPVQVTNINDVNKIEAGGHYSLALKSDGIVWGWGYGNGGQLGVNVKFSKIPVQTNNLTNIVNISAGLMHSLALNNSNNVFSWGANIYDLLGREVTTCTTYLPAQVNNLSNIISVSVSFTGSYAVKTDGTLWAWGSNEYGQLGDGSNINRSTPVQILSDIISVSGGGGHTLALKNDGSVYAWGSNSSGKLGDNTTINKISPVIVNGLTNIIAISAGGDHSLALKNDSTVWAWGNNTSGQVGDGSSSYEVLTPVQVVGLSNIIAISAGGGHSVALKNDGTVWSWGENEKGQLGDGTHIDRRTPVQVIVEQ